MTATSSQFTLFKQSGLFLFYSVMIHNGKDGELKYFVLFIILTFDMNNKNAANAGYAVQKFKNFMS